VKVRGKEVRLEVGEPVEVPETGPEKVASENS
jgi:hypothetical protein